MLHVYAGININIKDAHYSRKPYIYIIFTALCITEYSTHFWYVLNVLTTPSYGHCEKDATEWNLTQGDKIGALPFRRYLILSFQPLNLFC